MKRAILNSAALAAAALLALACANCNGKGTAVGDDRWEGDVDRLMEIVYEKHGFPPKDTTPTVTPPVTPPDTTPTVKPPAAYAVTVSSAGTGAIGAGSYAAGAQVTIYAGEPPNGQQFQKWTTTSAGVTLANANNATTTFIMPTNAVAVTAAFETVTVTPPATTKYLVTISSAGTGASDGGSYEAGETVTIMAGTAPSGQQFKNWTSTSNGVGFADANSATTTFTMPKNAVSVTAIFVEYDYVTIGGKKWMKKNIGIETANSWCYGNSPDSCAKYGRLYTWAAAKLACQSVGWWLPTNSEWRALVDAAGGYSTAGSKLKSKIGWTSYSGITNDDTYGFSALPGGRYNGSSFLDAGNIGSWWTATETVGSHGFYWYMSSNVDNVNENYGDESVGRSVRCVKN